MPMEIRLATPADSPGAVAVVKSVFDEYGFTWDGDGYHSDLFDLAGHYSELGHSFWIAEEAGAVLGTVALKLFERLPGVAGTVVEHAGFVRASAADCSLDRLYVSPLARRRGLGRQLTGTVIKAARSNGRELMELWSDKAFEPAHALYLGMGARIIGERICHDPDHSPEWGLIIDLRGMSHRG